MADSPERFGNTGIIELTGKIMVVTIVLLLSIVVFVFCFHLYAKYLRYRRRGEIPSPAPHLHRLPRRFDFSTGHPEPSSVSRRGLDPSLLKALPAVMFDPKELNHGSESMECAVCLSEVSDGERIRLLPGCSHGFHLDCIDMWFESHSTCPLCRNPIKKPGDELPPDSAVAQTQATQNLADGNSFPAEPPNFPTNVLIYGDDTQVTTFSPPVENNNNNNIVLEPSSSSISPSPPTATNTSPPDGRSIADLPLPPNEEDRQKSSMPMRLRSLKRLLSSNTRRVTPSSRILDIEQGGL